MVENEYRGKYEAEKKDPLKPWYPIIGLVLLAIAGLAGVLASGTALSFLQGYFPQLQAEVCSIPEIMNCQMQLVIAAAIALAIVGIFSLVFAIFAPKPKSRKLVAESALKTQKEEMNRERDRAKRRKMQMDAKMRKANKAKGSK